MSRVAANAAAGKWPGVLTNLGVEAALLTGKHVTCPFCSKPRNFRFDDRGIGSWICTCGAGDGFKLLQQLFGWGFKKAADEVERVAGFAESKQVTSGPTNAEKLRALRRVWSESEAVSPGDVVHRYLRNRGLRFNGTQNIRLHPGMRFRDTEGNVIGTFPVMLSRVQNKDGQGVSLHRTFLTEEGKKAEGGNAKQLMPGLGIAGAAIRLGEVGEAIGVAEGIETALALAHSTTMPVWSVVSASGMESFIPPDCVRRVVVFADNDASFTGQAAAYSLAKKLVLRGIKVEVMVPSRTGDDWLDAIMRGEL